MAASFQIHSISPCIFIFVIHYMPSVRVQPIVAVYYITLFTREIRVRILAEHRSYWQDCDFLFHFYNHVQPTMGYRIKIRNDNIISHSNSLFTHSSYHLTRWNQSNKIHHSTFRWNNDVKSPVMNYNILENDGACWWLFRIHFARLRTLVSYGGRVASDW